MAVTGTLNPGNANLQELQLHGSKTDSIVTSTDLETMADLQLLHGQVAIVVATITVATAVLLAAALRHGNSRLLLLRHRLSVNPAMVTARILAMIKAVVMEHLPLQLPQASARSCNNILAHLHLHQATGHHRLHHPTTLLPRRRRLITLLHLPRRERSYDATAVVSV